MSARMIYEATRNVTCLPVSEDGPSLFDWLDGRTTGQPGPLPRHASHSPQTDCKLGSMTTGIFGRTSPALSRSEGLQFSLESRLRVRLGCLGQGVTWKKWDTPWGQCRSRPEPSGPGTVGLGTGLLPTPSGTSNHGKNHVAGRLDEWGGSSNPFRGTSLGKVHCPAFELWVMGYPEAWAQLMPPVMPSSPRSRRSS